MTQRILPGSIGSIRCHHTYPAAIIGKVEEEFLLSVNCLVSGTGSPAIARPFGRTTAPGYLLSPMVCPVNKVCRRDDTYIPDITVSSVNEIAVGVIHVVIGHIDIEPALIFHTEGISSELVSHQGIVVANLLICGIACLDLAENGLEFIVSPGICPLEIWNNNLHAVNGRLNSIVTRLRIP